MTANRRPFTRLCYSNRDRISVRGRDLCEELIGKVSFTEMMLLLLTGKPPTQKQTAAIDAVLVTIMEHGLTPSAIAARQTLFGAPDALQGAVAAGILGVGDRFAGTAGDCAALLQEIVETQPSRRFEIAFNIADRFLQQRTPIPGYGHPIHKNGDPRVTRLTEVAAELELKGSYFDAMILLREAIYERSGRKLVINASAAMGALFASAGIPPGVMRGLTIVSRAAGIVAHLHEEMENPTSEFIWNMVEESVVYDDG